VYGTATGGNFAGALAQRRRRGLRRSDDRGALAGGGSGIVVIEQDEFEALAHVPFDMTGEQILALACPLRGQ
jgi:hypothetical protein